MALALPLVDHAGKTEDCNAVPLGAGNELMGEVTVKSANLVTGDELQLRQIDIQRGT